VRWLVFGSDRWLGVRHSDSQAAQPPVSVELGLAVERDDEDPARDSVALACDEAHLVLAGLTADRTLVTLRCDGESCNVPHSVARTVSEFALALGAGESVVGYTLVDDPRIRIDSLRDDKPPALLPAACWDPSGGMCGRPSLLYDGTRLLVGAREGADLLMIESEDGGHSFRAMGGLKTGAAVSTDPSAPMDQHRIRKGLQ
jgi:hypothetical protein